MRQGNGMERVWVWVGYLAASTLAWLTGLHNVVWALLILQGIDVFLGVLYALRTKTFRSAIGKAGMQKRIATWALIIAIGVVQYYTSILPPPSEANGMGVMEWATVGMTFMEFTSIVENCGRLGVPVPSWLLAAMEKVNSALGLTPREPGEGSK